MTVDINLCLNAACFTACHVFLSQGYLYSSAAQLYGVELNGEFCQLQEMIIKKYEFGDRIKVPYLIATVFLPVAAVCRH